MIWMKLLHQTAVRGDDLLAARALRRAQDFVRLIAGQRPAAPAARPRVAVTLPPCAIKAKMPSAKVVIGGLVFPRQTLPTMYQTDPALYGNADGVAVHPYRSRRRDHAVDRL